MADRKITDLTALTTPASADVLPIVDVSEAAAADKNKKITVGELFKGVPDGTAAAPAIAFESDDGNGIFLSTTDTVGIATNGSSRMTVSTTAVTSTLPVIVPDGTAAAPSVAFTGSGTDTGFYSAAANTLAASTGGTNALYIDSSQRVGIGKTSLNSTFEIYHATAPYIYLQNSTSGTGAGDGFSAVLSGSDIYLNNRENGAMLFYTNNTERARIDSSGRLLVGSTLAYGEYVDASFLYYGALQIARNSFDGVAQFSNWTSNTGLDSYGGTQLFISRCKSGTVGSHTGGALSSGNPIGRLIFNTSDGTNFRSSAYITAEVDGAVSTADVPGRLVFSTTADGASSPTERMTIKANGNVEFRNGGIVIISTAITSGAGNSTLKYNTTTGAVTYDTSSRLVKENIVDCPYGLDAVKLLQPRKYFRTDDQRDEIGFIADELVSILPEFVPIGSKSVITKNEQDTEDVPLGVNYEKLTAVLTKALQEAIAKIETLEQRLSDAGIA